jgi:hypothetical protein
VAPSAATTSVVLRRSTLLMALVIGLLGVLAPPAMAHTELEPEEATSGSIETLTFNVAYEGAGTTGLDVELPEGAAVVEVPVKTGWTSSTDDDANTVSWRGGPVEADEEFEVVVQLPDTTGVVRFPSIQLTTEGEVAWISPDEGEGHDTNPAPRMTLIADPNATTTTAPATTEAPTSTTADLPGTTVEAANEGDGGSAAPWLIGAGIAAIVAIAIGGLLLKRHADRAEASAAGSAGSSNGDEGGSSPGPGGSGGG